MDENFDEETKRIIEDSKKLLCRPWEEVVTEIVRRQTLGRRPPQAGTYPPPPLTTPTIDESNLPPAKSHIPKD